MTTTPAYLDPSLPIAARVDDLVNRMTLAEKVSQMAYDSPAIERLGIPKYNWWNECLHGVARAGVATVFPQAIGLAATWDLALISEVATAVSDEARAKHHEFVRQGYREIYTGLTAWSPNVNIFRDPRWGRGQETYGEDPYLTSRIGVAFVRGLQGEDDPARPAGRLKLVATPKHLAVHSGPEISRHEFDAVVSERDLRETYLRAFEACVKEGRAASVMGAYNRVNGEAACASPTLLTKILRDEWGFEGLVVSDCFALDDIFGGHNLVQTPAEAVAWPCARGATWSAGARSVRCSKPWRAGCSPRPTSTGQCAACSRPGSASASSMGWSTTRTRGCRTSQRLGGPSGAEPARGGRKHRVAEECRSRRTAAAAARQVPQVHCGHWSCRGQAGRAAW